MNLISNGNQINPFIMFMCVAIKFALKVSSFTFKIKIDIHIFSKSWRVIISISLSISKCLQYIIRLEKNVFNPFYLRLPCCIRNLKQVLLKQNCLKGNDYGVLKNNLKSIFFLKGLITFAIYLMITLLASVLPLPDSPRTGLIDIYSKKRFDYWYNS